MKEQREVVEWERNLLVRNNVDELTASELSIRQNVESDNWKSASKGEKYKNNPVFSSRLRVEKKLNQYCGCLSKLISILINPSQISSPSCFNVLNDDNAWSTMKYLKSYWAPLIISKLKSKWNRFCLVLLKQYLKLLLNHELYNY